MKHIESDHFRRTIAERHKRLFGLLRSGEITSNRLEFAGADAPFRAPNVLRLPEAHEQTATGESELSRAADFLHLANDSLSQPRRRFWKR